MDIICSALPYYYSSLALQGDVLSCGCFPFEGGPNNTIGEAAASVPSAKNAAGPRGKLDGDFIPKTCLVLRQGRAAAALWRCLCWRGVHGCFSLQRRGKAVVYNQENFLALQPDTSPVWNKSQKWVSFGTLLKIRNPCVEPGHGPGVAWEQTEGKVLRKGQHSLTSEGHQSTNCSKVRPPEVQEVLPCH